MKNIRSPWLTASLVALLYSSPALAKDIEIFNETDMPITQIECYVSSSTKSNGVILKNLAAQSKALVSSQDIPKNMCDRLVLSFDNGNVWQIYAEHDVAVLDKIHVQLNPINRHSKPSLPALMYEGEGKVYQDAPGIPFAGVWQILTNTTSFNTWEGYATPGAFGPQKHTKNFLVLGGISWDLTEYKVGKPHDVPVAMHFTAPVVTSAITPMIQNFIDSDFRLQKYIIDGKEYAPQGENKDALFEAFSHVDGTKVCQFELQQNDYPSSAILTFSGDDTVQLHLAKK